MVTLEFVEETVSVGNTKLAVAMGRLGNGVLLLISDRDHRIGTIAVGVPMPPGDMTPTATACVVGSRFQSAVRALAEITAQKVGGIALVNLFLSKDDQAYASLALSAVREFLMRIESEQ